MDGFMDSYVKRLKDRIARLETYPCRTCRDLAKHVEDLEEEVKKLRLEIHTDNMRSVING